MHAALRGNAAASVTMHETTLADGGASRFVSSKISCLAPV
jgi:hypothetical protein